VAYTCSELPGAFNDTAALAVPTIASASTATDVATPARISPPGARLLEVIEGHSVMSCERTSRFRVP
jgi:hypothetical protein